MARRVRKRKGYPGIEDNGGTGLVIRYRDVPDASGRQPQRAKVLPDVWDWDVARDTRDDLMHRVKVLMKAGAHVTTLEDLWVLYSAALEDAVAQGKVRRSTASRYGRHMNAQVRRLLGNPRLSELNRPRLHGFFDRLWTEGNARTKGPLSPKPIRNTHGFVHVLLEWGVKKGHLDSNPADGWDLPKVHAEPAGRAIEKDELRLLVDAAADEDRVAAMAIELAGACGLRNAEVRGCRDYLVHLDTLVLDVFEQRIDEEGISVPPKGDQRRRVPIPDTTAINLDRYITWRDARASELGPGYKSELAVLFPDSTGDFMTGKYLLGVAQRAAKRAGVGYLVVHDLRRSYATWTDEEADEEDKGRGARLNLGHATRNQWKAYTRERRVPRLTKSQRRVQDRIEALLGPVMAGREPSDEGRNPSDAD
jgi:integrase